MARHQAIKSTRRDAESEAGMGVMDGPVVDGGADFFEDEVEQQAGGDIA